VTTVGVEITMHSGGFVEILVTVKCIKIFIVAQQFFCDTFISQTAITRSIMSLYDVPQAAVKHKSVSSRPSLDV